MLNAIVRYNGSAIADQVLHPTVGVLPSVIGGPGGWLGAIAVVITTNHCVDQKFLHTYRRGQRSQCQPRDPWRWYQTFVTPPSGKDCCIAALVASVLNAESGVA